MHRDLQQAKFQCPHSGCTHTYTRKYRLREHLKRVHCDDGQNESKKNFVCPFACKVPAPAFRTDKELLAHCEKVHQDALGIYLSTFFLNLTMNFFICSHAGCKDLSFCTMAEFKSWKEREEEATYSTYVKGNQTYHPRTEGICIVSLITCCFISLMPVYRYSSTLLLLMLSPWSISSEHQV